MPSKRIWQTPQTSPQRRCQVLGYSILVVTWLRHDSNIKVGLAMDSLNSLLIGSYTLLSYCYSQQDTYLTLGSWKRVRSKKEHSSFFFSTVLLSWWDNSKQTAFSPLVFVLQIQTVLIRTYVCCLLSWDKGYTHIVKNIGSRLGKHLLLKGIQEGFTFLVNNSLFLYSICYCSCGTTTTLGVLLCVVDCQQDPGSYVPR